MMAQLQESLAGEEREVVEALVAGEVGVSPGAFRFCSFGQLRAELDGEREDARAGLGHPEAYPVLEGPPDDRC